MVLKASLLNSIRRQRPMPCEIGCRSGTGRFRNATKTTSRQARAAYDLAVSVYGECHEEFQEWHWEGTRDELTRLFAEFTSVADDLVPSSLPGLKPRSRVISLTRREPSRLHIAYAHLAYVEPATIAAPGMILREITSHTTQALSKLDGSSGDTKFDIALRPNNVWTFHLHVQPS